MTKRERQELERVLEYWKWLSEDEKRRADEYRAQGDEPNRWMARGAAVGIQVCISRLEQFLDITA